MEIMDKKKRDELRVKLYSVCSIRISITIAIHQKPKLIIINKTKCLLDEEEMLSEDDFGRM